MRERVEVVVENSAPDDVQRQPAEKVLHLHRSSLLCRHPPSRFTACPEDQQDRAALSLLEICSYLIALIAVCNHGKSGIARQSYRTALLRLVAYSAAGWTAAFHDEEVGAYQVRCLQGAGAVQSAVAKHTHHGLYVLAMERGYNCPPARPPNLSIRRYEP